MTDFRPNIAIVGGGLAGLTAAAAVARDGGVPHVFEAAKEVGGRARTRSDGGYRFNLGPHALYPGAQRNLRALGIELPGGHPRVAGVAQLEGRLYRLPATPWSLIQTRLLGPLDKADFGRVLTNMRRADPAEWHDRTVRDWVGQASERPAVRSLLTALMRLATYTNAPDEFSAGAALAQFAEATGVLYIDNGWGTLTGGLRERIEAADGSISSGAKVGGIHPSADGVELATRDGLLPFDGAVLTGSAREVVDVLGSAAPATLRRAADEAVSVRASVLDLGLRRLPRPRRTFGLGIDRPQYLSVHSAAARGLAPEGGATLNVARYTPVREKPDFGAIETQLKMWAEAVQPGWSDEVQSRGFFPDLTVMTDFPRAANGGLSARPAIDAAGIPGVFIAGDWVGPAGLLSDAATASGLAAGSAAVAVRSRYKAAVGVA